MDRFISNIRSVLLVLLLPCFIAIPILNANSVDPDQTPLPVASDLGLHYLQIFILWDSRHSLFYDMLIYLKTCRLHFDISLPPSPPPPPHTHTHNKYTHAHTWEVTLHANCSRRNDKYIFQQNCRLLNIPWYMYC